MSHSWKVIGRVYNKDGELHGNIIGLSGDVITVETPEPLQEATVQFHIQSLEKSGYHIEWVNVKPVGVYYGEF